MYSLVVRVVKRKGQKRNLKLCALVLRLNGRSQGTWEEKDREKVFYVILGLEKYGFIL